jgi:hypothetical protein
MKPERALPDTASPNTTELPPADTGSTEQGRDRGKVGAAAAGGKSTGQTALGGRVSGGMGGDGMPRPPGALTPRELRHVTEAYDFNNAFARPALPDAPDPPSATHIMHAPLDESRLTEQARQQLEQAWQQQTVLLPSNAKQRITPATAPAAAMPNLNLMQLQALERQAMQDLRLRRHRPFFAVLSLAIQGGGLSPRQQRVLDTGWRQIMRQRPAGTTTPLPAPSRVTAMRTAPPHSPLMRQAASALLRRAPRIAPALVADPTLAPQASLLQPKRDDRWIFRMQPDFSDTDSGDD